MSSTDASAAMVPRADNASDGGLRLRLVSALVMVSAAVGLAYVGGLAFGALVLVAAALMAYEWNRLCNGGALPPGGVLVGGVVFAVGAAVWLDPAVGLAVAALAAATAYALTRMGHAHALWSAGGVLYIAVPCIAVVWLRAAPNLGLETVFWLFAVVWATDIGAYAAGRGLGGPKLMPRVSPYKTWAGFVGGVLCAAAVGVATAAILGFPDALRLGLASAAVAVLGQAGDLGESMVKRHFQVKDSSHLIPGHGGVLDRLDSLMTAAPAVAAATLVAGEDVLAWR